MKSDKQFKVPRKPISLRIDIENCKPVSLSKLLQTSLVPPRAREQNQQTTNNSSKPLQLSASSSMGPRRALSSLSPTSPRTPHVLPEEPAHIPPLSLSRNALRRPNEFLENVESDLLPSPTNEEMKITSPLLSLRDTCSLCLDPTMLRLNGVDMECGHPVHLSCLREAKDPLRGSDAVCARCGQECKSSATRHSTASSTYSCQSPVSPSEDTARKGCDVGSLDVRSYVHATSIDTYEMVVRITANKSLSNSSWRHHHTQAESSRLEQLASNAIAATQVAKNPLAHSKCGSLRLMSSFTYNTLPVAAYLFDRYIVINTTSSDGFEDLVAMICLEDEDTSVSCVPGRGLLLTYGDDKIVLKGPNAEISKWLSAVNNLSLKFPLDVDEPSLQGPLYSENLDSCTLDSVLCTPLSHLSQILPRMLQQLGPQDRLGLVVVTEHGTCAWLAPHKPSWKHWRDLTKFDLESYGHFTPATAPVLQSAEQLLSGCETQKQRSVIVVSECPLASCVVPTNLTVHAVGMGSQYDLDLMSKLASQSQNGRFCHVENARGLANCCAGLIAADRTFVHHNIKLSVNLGNGGLITSSNPGMDLDYRSRTDENANLAHYTSAISVGSLVAGQTRTVSMEIKSPSLKLGSTLAHCRVESTSSVTGLSMSTTSRAIVDIRSSSQFVSRPIFFDRLALISAEILQECIKLATEESYETMFSLLNRAASKIQSTAEAASSTQGTSGTQRSFLDLSEPENSYEAQVTRSKLLAEGLATLSKRLREQSSNSVSVLRAMLLEAAQVLETQCAVTNKSLLEAVFFESLDCNRI